ncbi:ABC transporter substrate-binding protein [Aureimonas pseudogalii]|uniref:Putative spermidine/putrescine transport system substrate-binding protein n=1 Tax=Aureimonas pseudogalii TaxID=1744844 RepID=A0A7W6H621_9HYPH|nr:extracellular solute-binding protein [Aureimonas pseudogalii]MBB3999226.1 putative spermidine/putrescine transport system substrate-binding protein [Aureimonas pseudogalii]
MNELTIKRGPARSRLAAPASQTTERATLRILGTEITLLDEIRTRAEADLGIRIEFDCRNFQATQRQAARSPDAFDIYDQCFHNLDIVWYWRAVQAIDTTRIANWNEVSELTREGVIRPSARVGRGDAPVTRLYVQADGALGSRVTRHISMLPTVHNFDAFAYDERAVAGHPERVGSWKALLDPAFHGRVALVDEPAIGIFDAVLAAESAGLMRFADTGNLSVEEIDALIDRLLVLKADGHFAGFWQTVDDATRMMADGSMALGSMWSPSIAALKQRKIPVRQAVPAEGYRAWHGGLSLSARLEGRLLDVAYEYLNWWLSGWPGAVVARQGYYMSVIDRIRPHLSAPEWDYWYAGLPASVDLPGPGGQTSIKAGSIRSGGSYWDRAANIAVWNTTMDEHNYLVRRWVELVG